MAIKYAKLTWFFGGLKWGWSESWFWYRESGTLQDALRDARVLAIQRRKFLGTVYSIEAYRAEETDYSGMSFLTGASLISYNINGCGPGELAGNCQNPWQALYERFYAGPQGEYAKNVYLRGIPDDKMCIGTGYAVPFAFPLTLITPLNLWNGLITNGSIAGTTLVGNIGINVASEPQGKAKKVTITSIVVVNGKWRITTSGPIQMFGPDGVGNRNAGVGDVIHVHGPRAGWSRGLSADHTVTSAALSAPWVYDLSGRQKRICEIDYNMNAVAWGVNPIITDVLDSVLGTLVNPEISRPVNKKTGKPFFGTRGRRSACP